jgi:hypothetical protein
MGCRILAGNSHAILYCSTTDWAFGPVFYDSDTHDAAERLELFLKWLRIDPRGQSDSWLEGKYSDFLKQEDYLWTEEERVTDDD